MLEVGHLKCSEQNKEDVEEDAGTGQPPVATPQEYDDVSQADFSDLMDKISQQGDRITRFETQITQHENEITQQGIRIAQRGNRITQKGVKITQQGNSIAPQGVQIARQGNRITQQGIRITQQGVRITKLNNQIAQQANQIAQQGNKIAKLMEDTQDHRRMLSSLHHREVLSDAWTKISEDYGFPPQTLRGVMSDLDGWSHLIRQSPDTEDLALLSGGAPEMTFDTVPGTIRDQENRAAYNASLGGLIPAVQEDRLTPEQTDLLKDIYYFTYRL